VARDLCFSGRAVDAQEALRLHLVSAVVPVTELPAAAASFAAQIARAPRDVLLRTKAKAIRRSGVVARATLDL
jgi:enoyl-CoA hydratase